MLLASECCAVLAIILIAALAHPGAGWPLVGLVVLIAVAIALVLIPAVRWTAYRHVRAVRSWQRLSV